VIKQIGGITSSVPPRLFIEVQTPDREMPNRTVLRLHCRKGSEKGFYAGLLVLYPEIAEWLIGALAEHYRCEFEVVSDDGSWEVVGEIIV
jgi:hypothetical protein